MVSHGPDVSSSLGLLAVAVLVVAVLAILTARYGWRVLLAIVPAVVVGGLVAALGLPVPVALAAAAAAGALPTALLIRAAQSRAAQGRATQGRRASGAPQPAVAAFAPTVVPAIVQAQEPPVAAPPAQPLAAPAAAPAAMRASVPSAGTAGPAIMRCRTGKGWVRAAGFALFGVVFAALIAGAILTNPSADADGTRFALGLAAAMLVLFEALALVFVQHARSGATVDRVAGTVTVRRGRGLGMKRTVLPLSGVAAVEVASHERRVIAPKHGLGAVIELVRYAVAPKRETVYEVFLAPVPGGQRVLVSPFAEKAASAVLPLAEQLAKIIGCPLQVPSDPGLVPPGAAAAGLAASGPATPVVT